MSQSQKRKRQDRIHFRLLSSEKTEFDRRCEEAGVSRADYFRMQCLDDKPLRKRKVPPVESQLLLETLGQLGRIGSNVNQLAKACNSGSWASSFAKQIDEALSDIQEIRNLIRKALGYDH